VRSLRTVSLLLLLGPLTGCATSLFLPPKPAPAEVRQAALEEATRYIGMAYEWGGQELRPRGIDCSGLVVNAYAAAAASHGYALLFSDATASDMAERYVFPVAVPQPGDLVFMGEPGGSEISHVAIYDSPAEGGRMWIVDSTQIPSLGIDGVTRRLERTDDGWLRSYGRMALRPAL